VKHKLTAESVHYEAVIFYRTGQWGIYYKILKVSNVWIRYYGLGKHDNVTNNNEDTSLLNNLLIFFTLEIRNVLYYRLGLGNAIKICHTCHAKIS
jgi:hypothetical protein